MKKFSLVLALLILFFAVSCDSGIKFNNPNDINSDAYKGDSDQDTPDDDSEPADDSEPSSDTEPDEQENPDTTPDTGDTAADTGDTTSDKDADTSDSIDDSGDSEPGNDADTDSTDTADEDYTEDITDTGTEIGETRVQNCSELPENAQWNTVSAIVQTWDGEKWVPSSKTSFNLEGSEDECRFKCSTNYTWNNGVCETASTRTTKCQPKPENTVWNTVDAITQTYTSSGWEPSTTPVYNPEPSENECRYKCASGYSWNGESCTSGGSSLPECSKTSGTPCYDSTSHLTWSKISSSDMTYTAAITFCQKDLESGGMKGYGGFTDWRLPTISELRTLIQNCPATQMPPSGSNVCGVREDESVTCLSSSCQGENCYSCSSDSSGGHSKFGDTGWFWSSSLQSDYSNFAWSVGFSSGRVDGSLIDYGNLVRCVRGTGDTGDTDTSDTDTGDSDTGDTDSGDTGDSGSLTLGNICTGQTSCYNASSSMTCQSSSSADFYGQDAQYTNKCTPQSFSVQTLSSQKVVIDNNTGLMWQQTMPSTTYTWVDADSYCDDLTYAGYDDWRLPSPKEFHTISDNGRYAPAFDTTYFPGITNSDSSRFWTSQEHKADTTKAYYVRYYDAYSYIDAKTTSYNVMCVRGDALPEPVFTTQTISGEVVVNDSTTGLMWQKTYATGKTWQQALKYCEYLSYAGYSDWRLPNKNEASSLLNYNKSAAPYSDFPDMTSNWFWSSSTLALDTDRAWLVLFYYGSVSYDYKTSSHYVRCVR